MSFLPVGPIEWFNPSGPLASQSNWGRSTASRVNGQSDGSRIVIRCGTCGGLCPIKEVVDHAAVVNSSS